MHLYFISNCSMQVCKYNITFDFIQEHIALKLDLRADRHNALVVRISLIT